jgi:hypothetical protein
MRVMVRWRVIPPQTPDGCASVMFEETVDGILFIGSVDEPLWESYRLKRWTHPDTEFVSMGAADHRKSKRSREERP